MNWLLVGRWVVRGLSVLPAVFEAILAVERLRQGRPGAEKRAAAIDLVEDLVVAAEGAVGRDLLQDEGVRVATGHAIDAVVALLNALAQAKAGRSGLATPRDEA